MRLVSVQGMAFYPTQSSLHDRQTHVNCDRRLVRGERLALPPAVRKKAEDEDEDILRQSVYGVRNRLGRAEPWRLSRFRRASERHGRRKHLNGRFLSTSGIIGRVCSLPLVTKFSIKSVSDVASQSFNLCVPAIIGACVQLPFHEIEEPRCRMGYLEGRLRLRLISRQIPRVAGRGIAQYQTEIAQVRNSARTRKFSRTVGILL